MVVEFKDVISLLQNRVPENKKCKSLIKSDMSADRLMLSLISAFFVKLCGYRSKLILNLSGCDMFKKISQPIDNKLLVIMIGTILIVRGVL